MIDYSRYQCLKVEKSEGVAVVTLNRPEARNAFDHELITEVEKIWLDLADDTEVRAVVLTGSGNTFSVGGDVKRMKQRPGGDVLAEGETLGLKRQGHLIDNILRCEQPIICAINGDCIGLAATIALMCDITVASEKARIADTHVARVGLVAGDGGAVLWPMLVGPHRAKEFLMRGTIILGADAARMGLVNHAVPQDEVMSEALKIARELAAGPTWAIRWTKMAVNKWVKQQLNLIYDMSHALEIVSFHTDDHKEATRAFAEKRKPRFTGR
jgi:enoyl-CoA hydratase/carnithine racemase